MQNKIVFACRFVSEYISLAFKKVNLEYYDNVEKVGNIIVFQRAFNNN